ncbi:protein kinase C gamma type-like [Montipora foliosa]|uniref:protein kinase C gamma type-like n=1 Tax=Montipora foliosa TaxID=591990 RepID=UPI0035F1222D
MDFMEGGDLLTDLKNQNGRFPEATARFYISELICGLEFLHLNGIVHRDLKFDNVLINREGHIKIADFGLSHYGTPFEEICDNEICGTDLYIAPEVILLEPYDSSCEWWSLGIMCYIMLSGMHPFETGEQMEDLHFNIVHQDPLSLESCVSSGDLSLHAAELCLHLLEKSRKDRIGYKGGHFPWIRQHRFFHNTIWDHVENLKLVPPRLMPC